MTDSIERARLNLRKTVPSIDAFVGALEHQGLTAFSAILRRGAARRI